MDSVSIFTVTSTVSNGQPFKEDLTPKQEPFWCIRTVSFRPKWLKTEPARLSVFKNITFRNISVVGNNMMRVALEGGPGSGPITIENLTFNGKKIKSFDELFETYIGPNLKGAVILK